MHNYPLHRPVTALCLCCKRQGQMSFKSPSDHVLCAVCLKHQRSDPATLRRANAEHAQLWAADAADRAVQHERQVAKLREERDNLASELELRPVRTIEVSLDKQTMNEAMHAKDRAYRARDYAMSMISLISTFHTASQGRCKCGQTNCKEGQRLGDFRLEIDRWNEKQLDQLQRGFQSALALDHPLMLDRRGWVR